MQLTPFKSYQEYDFQLHLIILYLLDSIKIEKYDCAFAVRIFIESS